MRSPCVSLLFLVVQDETLLLARSARTRCHHPAVATHKPALCCVGSLLHSGADEERALEGDGLPGEAAQCCGGQWEGPGSQGQGLRGTVMG